MPRRSIVDRIFKEMQSICFRIRDIEKNLQGQKPQPIDIEETKLITLPDHLRRTYLVVAAKGEVDATQVSNQTGRSRAMESSYLNQLTRKGWLQKRKQDKKTKYQNKAKKQIKPNSHAVTKQKYSQKPRE